MVSGMRSIGRPSLPALVFALLTVPTVLGAAISLTFQAVTGGVTLSGAGTGTATLDFGTVRKYGTLAANVTRTTTASDYTLSTNLGTRVTKTGEPSTTSYTLRARRTMTNAYGWQVNSTTLTTTYATLSTTDAYATTYSRALRLVVPDAQTTGLSIVELLEFLAIAN